MKAASVAQALGGRQIGGGWMVRCPAHQDRTPSLSITSGAQGQVLVHCHAGCDQAQVIAALRLRGLWKDSDRCPKRPPHRKASQVIDGPLDRKQATRREGALRLWKASAPAAGTIAVTYLRSRGLSLTIPLTLRLHDGLKHLAGGIWPVMVALVTRGSDNAPLAIHRTFLARDGSDQAPVEPSKMMLGPCRGGAVRLDTVEDRLMVGEGIETCLSAMQATGRPAWAALSTSGLRALDLPDDIRDVTVLADGDEPGEAAAFDSARRWKREGRQVRIARPPRRLDFNDLLMGSTGFEEGGA